MDGVAYFARVVSYASKTFMELTTSVNVVLFSNSLAHRTSKL